MKRIVIFISLMILSYGASAEFKIENHYFEQNSNIILSPERSYKPKSNTNVYFDYGQKYKWFSRGHRSRAVYWYSSNSYYHYSPQQQVRAIRPSISPFNLRDRNIRNGANVREPFADNMPITRSSWGNNQGGPPTDYPIGDAVIPMLIFLSLYIFIKRKRVSH